ncbi:MAG: hypothetical protein M1819_002956 [Sarea resinae]|nr:MAG: hypothetical protein M1819_002956 [Sarea resinae]
MAPPRLHPRSRQTLSLFTSTLLLSFLIVGIPHAFPCPVRRTDYADGEMPGSDGQTHRRRRRRRPCTAADGADAADGELADGVAPMGPTQLRQRECPVPKPRGLVGEILGFKQLDKDATPMPKVVIASSGPRPLPSTTNSGSDGA